MATLTSHTNTSKFMMNAMPLDISGLLSTLPLFSVLSMSERERVAQGCQLKQLSRGSVLFRAGDACNAFYVVVSGQVRLFVASATGQEKVIEIIGPGHSFAEAMVFLAQPHIVNAQALSDTLLVCVCKQAVFAEVEHDPRFSLRMLAGISRRLHGLIQDVEAYALHSGMQRLIGYLLREVEGTISDDASVKSIIVKLPASKTTIASRLSLTPEYFSHVLHELENQGLVRIDKRDIYVHDIQKLATFGSH